MGRPAKAAAIKTGAATKQEAALRAATEAMLRGDERPECPDWLNENQQRLFSWISEYYAKAEMLSALDSEGLGMLCVAFDRVAMIDKQINDDPELMENNKLMSARKQYEATVRWGCTAFCLSPQDRAKLGAVISVKTKDAADPLAEALSD